MSPFARECLPALRAQTLRDFEVIVVDNGSQMTRRLASGQRPEIHVIHNETNLGFAAANNQAFAPQAPLIAVLNNDALRNRIGYKYWLKPQRETWAGMLASQILLREPADD
jgi:GT2 family glycosyltransferase